MFAYFYFSSIHRNASDGLQLCNYADTTNVRRTRSYDQNKSNVDRSKRKVVIYEDTIPDEITASIDILPIKKTKIDESCSVIEDCSCSNEDSYELNCSKSNSVILNTRHYKHQKSAIEKLSISLRNARASNSRLRRTNLKLLNTIDMKNKRINVWKSKYYKVLSKLTLKAQDNVILNNVKKIEAKGRSEVRKHLLLGETLRCQLKENKKLVKNEIQKSILAQMLSGSLIRKQKFIGKISDINSYYYQHKYRDSKKIILGRNNIKKQILANKLKATVRTFLEKDENSVIAPGSRDTITRNGVTKRKRFLSDNLQNLFKKYLQEEPFKISRTTFLKYRPFWIVQKTVTGRDTCLCKTHANFSLIIAKLSYLKVLHSNSSHSFIKSVTCDIKNKDCMYRNCINCKNRRVKNVGDETVCFYYQWVTEKIRRTGARNKIFDVKVTSKKKITSSISKLVIEINSMTSLYLKHVYDMMHQYSFLHDTKINLNFNEVLIIIDFSENYGCKYANEIQAVHFGASKKQLTLHTGVFYYRSILDQNLKCISFCTVSECLRHDAAAIWAHLQPVFKKIKTIVPNVDTFHFQSDGPTTQYKNKSNFQLFRYHCEKLGLRKASWNYTAPGHGKSSADAIGGTTKRMCDQAVASGEDILSVEDVIRAVNKSVDRKINIFPITLNEIEMIDNLIDTEIKSAPYSQKIFQIIWNQNNSNMLFLNFLSCSKCFDSPPCKHFSLLNSGWIVNEKKRTLTKSSIKCKSQRNTKKGQKQQQKIKKN